MNGVDFFIGIVAIIALIMVAFLFVVQYQPLTQQFSHTIDGSQYLANYTIQDHWQAPQTCKVSSFVVYTSQNGTLRYKSIYGNQTAINLFEKLTYTRNCTYG